MRMAQFAYLLICALLFLGGCDKVKELFGSDDEKKEEEEVISPDGGDVADGGDLPDEGGDGGDVADPGEDGTSGGGPADPPYGSEVIFPSGMRLDGLVQDAALTGTYPNPSSGSFRFGSDKRRHYAAVGYFIDIPGLSRDERRAKVSENFQLEEYVGLAEGNGESRIYVDAQVAFHAQELRYAWGGPLTLTSAFRSPEHNDAIGGSTFSRHLYGDAVDIGTSSTSMAWDLYNLAKFLDVSYLEPSDLTIVGKNSPWIHIDDRGWPFNTPETR